MGEVALSNGQNHSMNGYRKSGWYEEEIEDNLRWCFALNSILHTGTSQYQDIALLDTKPFGKALVIDGKLQSAETDEFIYHECLVHPPLLHHPNPKNVFIMGGGEGSTARELLRHNTIDKVIMCDIDEVNYITVSMHVGIGDKLITFATELPSGGEFRDDNEVGLQELR
ncbi:thermospermine synthase ACAULIS5-like isoform X2 [Arachis ipaensis]|uniref:thermospermine synthase ACAULIS5-like isoform X2 n=1 Tax=Arachis ipaensis TaxID=130454 RepID=UPI000A2B086C|nr:thermospermine synthase ACAULIS5-like isoform X2 [Arachis ipaensis]